MNMTVEQKLLELYLSNVDLIGDGFPVSFNAPRRDFMEGFNLMSLPSSSDEQYRHRDIKALFDGDWEHYFTAIRHGDPNILVEVGHHMTIDNGFCYTELALRQTTEGAVFGSLREAANRMEEIVLKYYNTVADSDNESVVALNSAFMQDGAFIYVPDGVTVEKPFVLSYVYTSHNEAQGCFPRTLIVLGKGAKAQVVVDHATIGEGGCLSNYVREVVVGDGATLELTELTKMNDASSIIINSYTKQSNDSVVFNRALWCSGGVTMVNGLTQLDGENSRSETYGLYMISDLQRCNVYLRMNHNKPSCQSVQLIKGIAGGSSVGSFTGRVYVAPDAQHTDAQQQNRNLQLSDTARIFTEPQLEIYADDVKCSHGATVGQLEDDSIYYMRQRGLSETQARKLQMAGFINDILGRCTNEGLCTKLRTIATERIDEMQ